MVRVLLAVLLLVACGGKSTPPRPPSNTAGGLSALVHVPADTPYVFAWESLPEGVWNRFLSGDLMKQAIQKSRDELAAKPRGELTVYDRIAFAYLQEIDGGDLLASLERTGFGRHPRMLLYGLSIWPAVRVEVADSQRVRATIERVLRAADVAYDVISVDGIPALTSTMADDDVIVFGFPSPNEAAFGYFPASGAGRYTRELLGLEAPRVTLASTGRLQRLLDDAGAPYMAGFLDFRALLRELGEDLDPTCREEMLGLIALAPTLEGFATAPDERTMKSTFRLVTDPAVSEALAGLAVPVPGLTVPPPGDPLFVAGFGVDLDAVDALVRRAAAEVRARPFRCEALRELNALAAWLAGGILPQIPAPFDRVRGFQVTVDSAQPVVAHAVMIHDHPLDLVQMLAQMVPTLASAPIRDDGKPVEIDASALGIPGVSTATVVVAGTRLAAGVGGDIASLGEVLRATPPAGGPLAVIGFDFGRLLELIGEDAMEEQLELAALMESYGFFSYALRVGARGIDLEMTMTLE